MPLSHAEASAEGAFANTKKMSGQEVCRCAVQAVPLVKLPDTGHNAWSAKPRHEGHSPVLEGHVARCAMQYCCIILWET